MKSQFCNRQGLAEMYVAAGMWDDALLLAAEHTELATTVHLPYAHWLLSQRRLDDARKAFRCPLRLLQNSIFHLVMSNSTFKSLNYRVQVTRVA